MEDRLLMTLEYLREYRTYFHISQRYQLCESSCYRIIRWIEDTLIKYPDFSLPGRKGLLKVQEKDELILMDATKEEKKNALTKEEKKNRYLSS